MSITKKTVSLILTFVLAFSALFIVNAGAEAAYTPVITVHGENTVYKYNEDGTYYELYGDKEYVSEIIDQALPLAVRGLITGNWDAWCDKAFEILQPAYEPFKPDEYGNVPEDTHTEDWLRHQYAPYTDYYEYTEAYYVRPDMRRSPLDEADKVDELVNRVMEVTGKDKVILNGRCIGNAVLLAYLYKYQAPVNFRNIESVIFAVGSQMGNPMDQAMLSGTMDFSVEALYNLFRDPDANFMGLDIGGMVGGEVMQILMDTLELAYRSAGINKLTVGIVNNVLHKVREKFIGRIMREYYGRCGVYAASVNEQYDTYKKFVYSQPGDEELFAAQIAKSDEYHYNVQLKIPEMIAAMQANGVYVANITQYGFAIGSPVAGETALQTSDGRIAMSRATMGAVCANVGETLPDSYIKERTDAGFGAYISPDRQVDLSTCLLPDTTWAVKNANHLYTPPIMDLTTAIMRHPGAKSDEIEGFPRFLNYTGASSPLEPLQEVNGNDMDYTPKAPNAFRAFITLLKDFFEIIKKALNEVFAKAFGR